MFAPARVLALVITLLIAAVTAPAAGAATVSAPDGLTAGKGPAKLRSATAKAAQASAGDPRSDDQWPLDGDGAMGAATAWRQSTGGDVTVAVIDSGADLSHPDLAANLWTNAGEIPGNGIDDDHNGYADDVHGYDFVDSDGTPQDENGHGTHVAGILAARGDNGIGIAGVAWRARLMVVRVLDAAARGTTDDVAEGLRYAVANGARIVNLSLAGPTPTRDLQNAIGEARDHGVLVVVAAGNDGRDLAIAPAYPASYTDENVIGVAATTAQGDLSSISDYGVGADIAAPGQDVLSTALGGGYEWRTGTSMAAPHVAGTLVLLAAARPDLDWRGLRDALLGGVRHLGVEVENGSLDAAGALRQVVDPANWSDAPPVARELATIAATTAVKAKAKVPSSSTASTTAKAPAKAKAKANSKARSAKSRAAARRRAAAAKRARARAAARRAAARRHR